MASLHFAICAALLLLGAANRNGIERRMGDTRIAGAYVSNFGNIPWMVALQDSSNFFCGGSILNPCYVLTSAECVIDKDPEALTIRGGSSRFNESGNEYAARSIIIHPKFSGGLDYNVALIQMWASIGFGETVQPIPLADREPKPGEALLIAGWGAIEESGEFQYLINLAVVRMADKGKCERVYDNVFALTDRMICTYEQLRGACHGDNGGPVVYYAVDDQVGLVVAGVISHKVGCGMYPDIHTNTVNQEIRDFILNNAREECT